MRTTLFMAFLLIETVAHADFVQHQFEGSCDVCHLVVPESPDDDPALAMDVNAACQTCHEMPTMGHPIDATPMLAAIPDDFPLEGGRLLCATCHTPCGEFAEGNPYMLRGDLRKERFCSNCHRNSPIPMEKKHYGISGVAHPRTTEPVMGSQSLVDDITLICMSCHTDGGIGPAANIIVGEDLRVSHSHSVGTNYEESSRWDRELRSYASVSEVVVLREGKVGCLSCHNIYSKKPPLLAMNNSGSRLCMTCHDK